MKNRTAWIAIALALGLVLGAVVTTTGAIEGVAAANDVDGALAAIPRIDCGEGREALLEPVTIDGVSSFRVRCVRIDDVSSAADASATTPVAAAPPVVVVTPAVAHAPAPSSAPEPARADAEIEFEPPVERRTESERSWKESAVIIGGAAGTGAGIGALAKGKKGAVVGAAIGAASGAAYELIKKDGKR